ncbi:sterol-binding protein [Rhodanobacter thiooxydans]|uniref:Sterol-binding protein n=1 Tax=Rhodanobacter thiooxydans TaxID=416169 RepID=A0A154QF61_9GAMM|nr:SCP2 sterol-binding domain-containing protein [Rhodanobacter thiooxydans]EIM03102.1 sterol-binding domain-containing protein [Rhodanobacter thiooxydans LCS2]KZC22874.1 sterol-binding protein [Rhodanobacter thiooxydans]MCW0200715.1 SCP2 sterol-binding domain-containing protein [Rhodanobacter thiooxydans]
MSALELLHKLPLAINLQSTAGVDRTIQFNISQPAYVVIRNGACEVTEGSAENADLSLKMSDDDLVSLLTGKLDGMAAMMTGKLKLQGDMALAAQLGRYFDAGKLQ